MKRISVLILVAALAVPFAIAACGGGGGGGGGGTVTSEYVSSDTPINIPDNNLSGIISYINVSGIAGTIAKVTVDVNITHSFDWDLGIILISPEGTVVDLAYSAGGDGNNFDNTRFDDDASQSIQVGSAPFAGSYIPLEPLHNLDGEDPNGTWSLVVFDDVSDDTGTLNSWGLNID
jgi:subtilisin-like proprotein convertase family protein